jgi:glycosyltransferase involved in cell wall biosynthesis
MMRVNQLLEQPLVSVIIPSYNRANLISIPLKSVINQSYTNIEILVIDDGSIDNTEEVVKAIGDSRIRYIRQPTNRGGAATRNTGIEMAQGEYVAFLDSDDAWVPDKLELQLAAIQKCPYPEKVVSYTQVFYSESGITESTYHAFDEKFFLPKKGKETTEAVADYLYCNQGKMLTSTLMLHRLLALNTRFRDGLKKHQDHDFALRLESKGAIFSFLQKPLTIWNGDPRYEHVGRIPDYRLSESFIRENRAYISSKAATAFLLEKVLPFLMKDGQRKLYAQKLILDAFLQRLISWKKCGKLTSQLWISGLLGKSQG